MNVNYFPVDIFRIIFMYVGDPALTSKICKKWHELNKNTETIKYILSIYKEALGNYENSKFITRSGIRNIDEYEGFLAHLKHQWRVLKQYTNAKGILKETFKNLDKSPASVPFIKAIEKLITANEEVELYQFCILILSNPLIHFNPPKSYHEYQQINNTVGDSQYSAEYINEIKAGTQLWVNLKAKFNLSTIIELKINLTFFGLPSQVEELTCLKKLSFDDFGEYCVPWQLEKLIKLEELNLGMKTHYHLPERLLNSSHPIIRKAFKSWKDTHPV